MPTVQWRILWLGLTTDRTAGGGSLNQRNADKGLYWYPFCYRYGSWKVMWYQSWVGTQFYSKKGHKSHATPLLWNPATKKEKIKTADVTFFLDVFWTMASAYFSKIKSDFLFFFSIICVIFYIPNSLNKNCVSQYKEILQIIKLTNLFGPWTYLNLNHLNCTCFMIWSTT